MSIAWEHLFFKLPANTKDLNPVATFVANNSTKPRSLSGGLT